MILLDLTTHAVTVEGDGNLDTLVTVRTLETEGSVSRVARFVDGVRTGRTTALEETARARQGSNVMREYDIVDHGVYVLSSGRRDATQCRTFYVALDFPNVELMQMVVLPGSFPEVPWVVGEDLHQYRQDETFAFSVRVTLNGVALADGEITHMSSDQTGVKYERTTAWERLLDDEDPNPV
jgi:hypothetical protein